MKPLAIILFVVVIILLAIHRYRYIKHIKWLKQRATEKAKLYHYFYEHGPRDCFDRIECECGYVKADTFYSGQFIKSYSHYEGKICPKCHGRWVKPEYIGWRSKYGK